MNHTEEKLEEIAKALVAGRDKFVWAVDRDMRLIYFNALYIKEYEYAFGVKPKQWESIYIGAQDHVRDKWMARYLRVFETGEPITLVYGQMAAGGEEIRYHEVLLAPLCREGEVVAVVGEGFDATEINWYKEVFRHMPDIVYEHDLKGIFTRVSDSSLHFMGYAPKDVLGMSVADFVAPEHLQKTIEEKDAKAKDPSSHRSSYEVLAKKKDGSFVWVEILSWPVIVNGQVVRIRGLIRDISERKKVQDRYSHLMQHAPVAVFVSSLQGKLYLTNNKCAQMFGFSGYEEMLAWENPMTNLYVDSESRGRVIRTLIEPPGEYHEFELRMKTQGGREFWVNMIACVSEDITGNLGAPAEMVMEGFMLDITHRKTLERRTEGINRCLMGLGPEYQANMDNLMALCGQELDADESFYVRMDAGAIRTEISRWGRENKTLLTLKEVRSFCERSVEGDDFLFLGDAEKVPWGNGVKTCLVKKVRLEDRSMVGAIIISYSSQGKEYSAGDEEYLGIISAVVASEETRRIAHLAIYEREEKYRQLIETTRTLLWEMDANGIITYVNSASYALYDYTPTELVGKHYRDFLSPESSRELGALQVIEKATLVSERTGFEARVISKTGKSCWMIFDGALIFKDGELAGWRGIGTDVTERKQRELRMAALKEVTQSLLYEPQSYQKYLEILGSTTHMEIMGLYLADHSRKGVFVPGAHWEQVPGAKDKKLQIELTVNDLEKHHWSRGLLKGEMALEPATYLRELGFADRPVEEYAGRLVAIAPVFLGKEMEGILAAVGRDLREADTEFVYTAASLLAQDILRNKIESKAAASEAMLLEMTENAHDIIFSVSHGGKIIYVNKAVEKVLGYTKEEAMALPLGIYDLIHPAEGKIAEGIATGNILEWAQPIAVRGKAREAGRAVWLEIQASGRRDGNRELVVECIARDVTAKLKAERMLRESERRYRAIIEHVNLLAVMINSRGELVMANSRFLETTGREPEDVYGHSYADAFVPQDKRKRFTDVFNSTTKTKICPPVTYGHLVTKNGEVRVIEWNNTMLFGLHMDVIGVASIGTDITERKIAEHMLQESEKKYRTLVDNLPVGICRIAARGEGQIVAANQAMAAMLGYSLEELLGLSLSKINAGEEDTQVILWRGSQGEGSQTSLVLKKKKGSRADALAAFSPVRGPGGEALYLDCVIEDVSEKIKAKANLQQLMDRMKTGIVVTGHVMHNGADRRKSPRGDILFYNWEFTQMTGYTAPEDEFAGKKIEDLVCDEHRQMILDYLGSGKGSSAAAEIYEAKLRHKLGKEVWAQLHATTVNWADGKATVISFANVTKRKIALDRLRLLHEISYILDSCHEELSGETVEKILGSMIAGARMDCGYVYMGNGNGSAKMALKAAIGVGDEMSAVNPLSLVPASPGHPLFMNVESEAFTGAISPECVELLSREGISGFSVLPMTHNGRALAVFFLASRSMASIPPEAGEFLETASREIAGHMSREFAEKKLADSEAFHRYLIENTRDGIFIIHTGTIVYANHEFAGYSEENLKALQPGRIVPAEDRAVVTEAVKQVLENKATKQLRHRLLHKENRILWVNSSLVPITWKGESAILTYMRDITELKAMEDSVFQTEKMNAIGTLAGGMAHDFNNVLMGIQGHAALMLMKTKSVHANYSDLKSIEQLVESGTDITRQLLGFARGGLYDPRPLAIKEFIERLVRLYSRTKREIAFHPSIAEDVWNVYADKGQMDQVFMNLFVNASQAMPGGGDLFISAENLLIDDPKDVLPPGSYVKISVTDTGVGMDESTKDRIFEPFFTSKEMGRGTGLGLATVYGIIHNHGGHINVHSTRGHGSTFNIYLPAIDKPVVAASKKPRKAKKAVARGKETLLLVEDEEKVMNVTKRMLEEMGYTVLAAMDGKEAVKIYKENKDKIDVVVLDMIMPGYSGERVFNDIRKFNPVARVLLASGYSVTDQAKRILEKGCLGFIQKPYGPERLGKKIREVADMELPEPKNPAPKSPKKNSNKTKKTA